MRLAAVFLSLALAMALDAQAASYRKGAIEVGQPWSRPAAKGFNGAGYLTLTNHGKTADTLTGVVFPDATRVTLHQSQMKAGVASMAPMSAGVRVAPGSTVKLAPGGAHAMLMGLKAPLTAGERRPATLVFASGLKIPIEFAIQAGAPATPPHGH